MAFRKHFAGCSHGHRFTYSVRAQDPKFVHWRRSDGLEGRDTLVDWARLYTADNDNVVAPPKPKAQTQRELRASTKTLPPKPPTKDDRILRKRDRKRLGDDILKATPEAEPEPMDDADAKREAKMARLAEAAAKRMQKAKEQAEKKAQAEAEKRAKKARADKGRKR